MKPVFGKSPHFKPLKNVSLGAYSAYKIGGVADYFFIADSFDILKIAFKWAKDNSLPVFILGGGTNVLFSDNGFRGLVIQNKIRGLEVKNSTINPVRGREGSQRAFASNGVKAGAGVLMSELIDFTLKNNLKGLQWAGGLPGTLGGAIRGNAGCFGEEIKNTISKVLTWDGKKLKNYSSEGCGFAYRHSIFKENNEIIISAVLNFKKADFRENLEKEVAGHISYRENRQPLEYANCGSVFKNCFTSDMPESIVSRFSHKIKNDPEPLIPAAVLISEAGLAGLKLGNAAVSNKHANFIINLGGARASEIVSLMEIVKEKVKKQFGVELKEEIQLVGF